MEIDMPEWRRDPIQKCWVIIASERADRPDEYTPYQPEGTSGRSLQECPFCEGNEDKTPPEVFAVRPSGSPDNGPGWQVRVIPNKYPALAGRGDLDRKKDGFYERMNGIGAHEVIIETPIHHEKMTEMTNRHLSLVLQAYRQRLMDLREDPRLKYILLFKNHGPQAGASLAHPHTQIIATPIVPRIVRYELQSSREYFHRKERCLFCDMIEEELTVPVRIVHLDDHFVTMAPFASRFPYELFLVPRRHQAHFTDMQEAMLPRLATHLQSVLRCIREVLQDPPFNLVLHTAPNIMSLPSHESNWETLAMDYHWHMEIIPRLTRVAGFEWGTGYYINTVAPEDAARCLRKMVR